MQETLQQMPAIDITSGSERFAGVRSHLEGTRATLSALGCAVLAVFDLYRH